MSTSSLREVNEPFIASPFVGMTVIWQTLESVEVALRSHMNTGFVNEKNPVSRYNIERRHLDLNRVQFGNPAYRADPIELCLYTPICSPYSCVWIANIADGWSSLLWFLGKRRNWVSISVRSSLPDDTNWIQEFQLIKGNEVSRCIRIMWDGHPDFFSSGPPMFCEDLTNYDNRSIKMRLSRHIIAQYLTRLGLPVQRSDFWISHDDALYFRRSLHTTDQLGGP
jgi:hypothetical protein